jgi:hypothetical protein
MSDEKQRTQPATLEIGDWVVIHDDRPVLIEWRGRLGRVLDIRGNEAEVEAVLADQRMHKMWLYTDLLTRDELR